MKVEKRKGEKNGNEEKSRYGKESREQETKIREDQMITTMSYRNQDETNVVKDNQTTD